MKTLLPTLALIAFALPSCTKAPEPAPQADDYAHEEILQLRKELKDLETWVKAPNTAGLETADIGRRLMQFEQRIKTLEEHGAAAPKAGGAPADDGTSGTTRPAPTTSLVPGDGTEYSTQQIADFRKILDVVEKQKRDEQSAERIKTQLKRIGADLTPDQEKAVTTLTLAYQQKQGEIIRGGFGATEADRKTTNDQIEALRAQYETDLRSIVPTAAADKLVEGMGRGFPGFLPRRIDGTTRGGMGNN